MKWWELLIFGALVGVLMVVTPLAAFILAGGYVDPAGWAIVTFLLGVIIVFTVGLAFDEK